MSWRIGRIVCKNFGPFKDMEVNLSAPGVTVIEGEVKNRTGCNSNGAGKSSLIDATAWAIWGRCIREKHRGDDVIRWGQKTCFVRLEIEGEKKLVVERYRNHPKHKDRVYLILPSQTWEDSPGTNAETEQLIESHLGMDFLTYVNSAAFGARDDVKGFLAAPDSARKEILGTLLGLSRYARAEAVARTRLKTWSDTMSLVRQDKEKAEMNVGLYAENLAQLETSSDAKQQLELLRGKLRELKSEVQQRTRECDRANGELERAGMEFRVKEISWQTAMQKWQAQFDGLNVRLQEKKKEWSQAEAEWMVAKKHLGASGKLTEGVCQTCGQPVSASHIGKLTSEAEQMERDFARLVDAAEMEAEQVQRDVDELKKPESTDRSAVVLAEVNKREADRMCAEAKIKCATMVSRVSDVHRTVETWESQVKEAREKKEEAERELSIIKTEMAAREKEGELIQFWVKGFGDQGIRSFLIEAEIPRINQHATGFAHRFLGEGTELKLSATSELKNGKVQEKLSIETIIPGMTRSYTAASRGQQRRMDLAIVLALWKLVSARAIHSFDQLFIDEIFDGLDAAGSDAVADLLTELGQTRPVIVVTHDERLRRVADRVLVVRHNGSMTDPVAEIVSS